jgi:hypothetical protein
VFIQSTSAALVYSQLASIPGAASHNVWSPVILRSLAQLCATQEKSKPCLEGSPCAIPYPLWSAPVSVELMQAVTTLSLQCGACRSLDVAEVLLQVWFYDGCFVHRPSLECLWQALADVMLRHADKSVSVVANLVAFDRATESVAVKDVHHPSLLALKVGGAVLPNPMMADALAGGCRHCCPCCQPSLLESKPQCSSSSW